VARKPRYNGIHLERDPVLDKIVALLYYITTLLDLNTTIKILIAIHLKPNSFWPIAYVKPMSNYIVLAMH
jgi:hypothetical protein